MLVRRSIPFFLALALPAALAALEPARADIPRKPPLSRYAVLWTDSPITTKPSPEAVVEGPDPLQDWTLGGISKIRGGFLVLLFNATDPTEVRVIKPGEPAEFEVLDVHRDARDYLQTRVQLRYRGQVGWVSYNREQLALQPPPQPAGQPPQPPQPEANGTPDQNQNQARGRNNNRRQRIRTVVPPPPNRGGR